MAQGRPAREAALQVQRLSPFHVLFARLSRSAFYQALSHMYTDPNAKPSVPGSALLVTPNEPLAAERISHVSWLEEPARFRS